MAAPPVVWLLNPGDAQSPLSGDGRACRGARYGTLGGTSETLRDLIGKRVIAGLDPGDGILGLSAFWDVRGPRGLFTAVRPKLGIGHEHCRVLSRNFAISTASPSRRRSGPISAIGWSAPVRQGRSYRISRSKRRGSKTRMRAWI